MKLHRAAHREHTAQTVFVTGRSGIKCAPSATVDIPPTAASWTNSQHPHLSMHWDDHITGMITSTSWEDHLTGMITSTHKNAKLWIAYFLCATRRCRVLSMLWHPKREEVAPINRSQCLVVVGTVAASSREGW